MYREEIADLHTLYLNRQEHCKQKHSRNVHISVLFPSNYIANLSLVYERNTLHTCQWSVTISKMNIVFLAVENNLVSIKCIVMSAKYIG